MSTRPRHGFQLREEARRFLDDFGVEAEGRNGVDVCDAEAAVEALGHDLVSLRSEGRSLRVVFLRHSRDLVERGSPAATPLAVDAGCIAMLLDELDLDRAGLGDSDLKAHRAYATVAVGQLLLDDRQDVERADTECLGPGPGGRDDGIDDVTKLEEPEPTLGPGLLEQRVRGSGHRSAPDRAARGLSTFIDTWLSCPDGKL